MRSSVNTFAFGEPYPCLGHDKLTSKNTSGVQFHRESGYLYNERTSECEEVQK